MDLFESIYPYVEKFNTWTGPIAFFLTIFTFVLAFNTKRKIEETKEISLFNEDLENYIARLEGIHIVIDNIEDRYQPVPEKIILEVSKIASEAKKRYPTLYFWRREMRIPLRKIQKLQKKKTVTLIEFIDPYNELKALFWTRKEFPK